MQLFGYVRVSTGKENQRTSIKNQYQMMLDEGVPSENIFIDDGVSGWKQIKRRGFDNCLDACRAAAVAGDGVTLYIPNDKRFGRLAAEGMLMLADLEKSGVRVYDLLNRKFLSAIGDQLIETGVKLLLAQAESERLSLETKRNYARRRSQGRAMGGEVPWGYRRCAGDKGKLEIVPELREPLREMAQWALDGLPLRQIAQRVADGDLGIQPPRRKNARKPFNPSRVRDWLKSPIVRGHTFYKQNGVIVDRKYNTHEALVSDDEWRIIESRILDNKENHARWNNRQHPLSARYLRCGECGSTARVYPSSGRRYVRCSNTESCDHSTGTRIDVVIDAINAALNRQAQNIAKALIQPQVDEVARQRIISLERERDELAVMAASSSREGLKAALEEVEVELRSLRHKAQASQPANLEEYREYLELFKDPEIMQEATLDEQVRIYKALVQRVEVLDGGVKSVVTIWG